MARRRRSAESAQSDILAAAQELLLEEGPSGLRLQRVAERVGMTHPGVLHHFGSVEHLLEVLSQRTAREVRDDVLAVLKPGAATDPDARNRLDDALERLADPGRGRLLAWLVSSGRSPFPPEDERGLEEVVTGFQRAAGGTRETFAFVVEFAVLASLGDALFGAAIRKRMGAEGSPEEARSFRERLLGVLEREVGRGESE